MDDITQIAAASMQMAQAQTQMSVNVAMTKKSLDFEASITASLINGSLGQGMEVRNAGLAAQGIGTKLNAIV